MDGREIRKMAGMLCARLPELQLAEVPDPRKHRGKRWALAALLRAVIVGMTAGCKSLLQLEALTSEMSSPMRTRLGLKRRVPDTTVRDVLCKLSPGDVVGPLHRQVKAAHRRKALEPVGLPFGTVALDGKETAVTGVDDKYAQRQSHVPDAHRPGIVRTLTCTLTSSRAKVCIDAQPIDAKTNEMGHFEIAIPRLMATYGKSLFQLITYDAGACSLANASLVVSFGLDYLLGLKGPQPTLLAEAERLLAKLTPAMATAVTDDVVGAHTVTRRLYLTTEMAGFLDWGHLKTVLRVETEKVDRRTGERVAYENRYFLASLSREKLTDAQWLAVVRGHWAVENNCHHTWDTAFQEDDRRWIEACPRATVVVDVLRRIAYNMLALFRSVTQRSEDRRQTPWRDLLRWVYNALIAATNAHL